MRPSSASLNSLAKVLREASPIYQECHSILNGLPAARDACDPVDFDYEANDTLELRSNNDAGNKHRILLEPLSEKPM